ncbi:hypothetical protein FRY77_02745 [Halomonas sp. MG34]|nr:hypothetical protein [Halomonas sp. MG34]
MRYSRTSTPGKASTGLGYVLERHSLTDWPYSMAKHRCRAAMRAACGLIR